MRLILAAVSLVALSGCAEFESRGVIAQPTRDWRTVVTDVDRTKLRDWRTAFVEALQDARNGGFSAEIQKEGALLNPDAALGGPIPDGNYHCRVIKLGAKSGGTLNYVSYPYFNCRVSRNGQLQDFAKLSGSQRQVGALFPGDQLRQVFLGTLVLGDEARAFQYGRDTDRDVAGYVERIGENRWRLIMPRPAYESVMDVMELVPAS